MVVFSHNDVASYLTTAEYARVFRVSTATVRAHAEQLGGERVGRQWRFPSPIAVTLDTSARGPHPVAQRIRNAP